MSMKADLNHQVWQTPSPGREVERIIRSRDMFELQIIKKRSVALADATIQFEIFLRTVMIVIMQ